MFFIYNFNFIEQNICDIKVILQDRVSNAVKEKIRTLQKSKKAIRILSKCANLK